MSMFDDDRYAADYGPAAMDERRHREDTERVRKLVESAVLAERERCAKIVRESGIDKRGEVERLIRYAGRLP